MKFFIHFFLTAWLVSIISPLGLTQSFEQWRYWTISDGLEESWSTSISIGPSGKIWINHGDVDHCSCLEGYQIVKYPIPSPNVKIKESHKNTLWSICEGGILRFHNETWILYPIPEILDRQIPFLPTLYDDILILLEDRLLLFDGNTNETKIVKKVEETKLGRFNHLIHTNNSNYCITGQNGIVLFSLEGKQVVSWVDYFDDKLPYFNYVNPWQYEQNGIYITATNQKTNNDSLLFFSGGEWDEIFTTMSKKLVRGWCNSKGELWLQWEDNSLTLVHSDGRETVYREELLSGRINDLVVEDDGTFWIATSQGVVRYAPSIWSIPREIADVKNTVNSIYKDKKGNLWFDCTDFLLVLEKGKWTRFVYPSNIKSQYYETGTLCPLPDERISIRTLNSTSRLLVFNPEKQGFEYLSQPENLLFGFMCLAEDETIWIQIGENFNNPKLMTYRIDKYDGHIFDTILDISDNWKLTYLRSILKTNEGVFWFGGTSGLAQYKEGEYRLITEEDGFTESAAFSLLQHPDGKIWVGGRNSILSYNGEIWETVLEDLDQIRSFHITKDEEVWIATIDGIYREFSDSWIQNSKPDGMTSKLVNDIAINNEGEIWLATSSGICVYNPNADQEDPDTIISLDKTSKRFPPGEDIHIFYEGIDKWKHTTSDRLYYTYRIDNSDWIPFTPNTVASFSALRSGSHRFEVRSIDRNLNIDPSPAVFEFTVLTNWYQEPMFLTILTIGLIVVFVLLFIIGHHYWLREQLHSRIIKQSQELKIANEELKRLSFIDGLTEISNRRRFENQLDEEWRRAMREQNPITIIMIDVDFFKKFNDQYGHQAGDDCLRLIAKTIQCSVRRAGDLVARYGGEEFIVLLVNSSIEKATIVAEKIRKQIEKLDIPHNKSDCADTVTISLGVSSSIPLLESSANRLIQLADQALYQAKRLGRNCVKISEISL